MNSILSEGVSAISNEELEDSYNNNEIRFKHLKQQLEKTKGLKLVGEYEDMSWKIIDFNKINSETIKFHLDDISDSTLDHLIKKSLKSWCLVHLENQYAISLIRKKINYVLEAIKKSNVFDLQYLELFEQNFFKKIFQNTSLYSKAQTMIDFIEYSSLKIAEEYSQLIYKVYDLSIKNRRRVREIPLSQDVLKFSLLIEDYFKNDLYTEEYLKFYPIYLWWNLTNIIPLRIQEFCLIKAGALIPTKDGYQLELPRIKDINNPLVNYDCILISDAIAESIINYQRNCINFRKSKTLLNSWIMRYDFAKKEYKSKKVLFEDYFTYPDFAKVLKEFYDTIVKEKYGFIFLEDNEDSTEIEVSNQKDNIKIMSRRVRPNDTRHFAFINLMLQGYHPSEIKRLGGHKSIHSQYSYHSHLEHWVDSDLLNLLMFQKKTTNNISNQFFLEILLKQKIILADSLEEFSKAIPLRVGVCLDPNQNCMVDQHYLCEHWRISKEDYENHSLEIIETMEKQKSLLKKLMKQLLSLQEVAINNSKNILYSKENSKFNYKLVENANEVKQNLYRLFQMEEKISIYEK